MKGMARVLAAFLFAAAAGACSAAEGESGTASAVFLNLGGSARMLAMGGAGAGCLSEPGAIWINPAQLSFLKGPQASYMHGAWVEGLSLEQMALAGPTPVGSYGLAVTVLSMGTIESLDANGNSAGSVKPRDFSISAGGAWQADLITFGGSVSYLRSELAADAKASAVSAGLGLSYAVFPEVTVSGVLQNVGTPLRYDSAASHLPLTVRGGGAISFLEGKVLVAADAVKSSDAPLGACLGAEYEHAVEAEFSLCFRTGWSSISPEGSGTGITVGGGLDWHPLTKVGGDPDLARAFGEGYESGISGLRVDYAWTPMGELGVAHWISFGLSF